jgi:nickel-type superoxide dismutase maturation protease
VALVALIAGLAAAYGFLRWRPFRMEVEGPSMRPALEPGDWAIAIARVRVRRGDIVVVEHPERPGLEIVKRVVNVSGDVTPDGFPLVDQVWIEGDEPESSTDSRQFGPVAIDRVRGRVRLVWWPPDRVGLVRSVPGHARLRHFRSPG